MSFVGFSSALGNLFRGTADTLADAEERRALASDRIAQANLRKQQLDDLAARTSPDNIARVAAAMGVSVPEAEAMIRNPAILPYVAEKQTAKRTVPYQKAEFLYKGKPVIGAFDPTSQQYFYNGKPVMDVAPIPAASAGQDNLAAYRGWEVGKALYDDALRRTPQPGKAFKGTEQVMSSTLTPNDVTTLTEKFGRTMPATPGMVDNPRYLQAVQDSTAYANGPLAQARRTMESAAMRVPGVSGAMTPSGGAGQHENFESAFLRYKSLRGATGQALTDADIKRRMEADGWDTNTGTRRGQR